MATAVASGNRAFFTIETSGGKDQFHVQFNPKELKLDDAAAWKAADEHGQGKPLLTYERGEPATLSMDLIFDATVPGPGAESVQSRIDALRAMTYPSIRNNDTDSSEEDKAAHRPPHVDFFWGKLEFRGIVEKVAAVGMMFAADGSVLRAKVTVSMKERTEDGQSSSASGSQIALQAGGLAASSEGATTTVVQPGETATQVAQRTNSDVRAVLAANPGANPTELQAGAAMVIPASMEQAQVLGQQALGVADSNFAVDNSFNPLGSASGGWVGTPPIMGGGDDGLSELFSTSGLLSVVDKAAAGGHDLLDGSKDKLHEVADKVVDKGVGVADKVGLGDKAEGLRDDAHEGVDKGVEEGHDQIDNAQEAAHDALGDPDFEAPERDSEGSDSE